MPKAMLAWEGVDPATAGSRTCHPPKNKNSDAKSCTFWSLLGPKARSHNVAKVPAHNSETIACA